RVARRRDGDAGVDEGGGSRGGIAGDDRFGSAAFRGPVRRSGGDAVRTNAYRLERDVSPVGDARATRGRLRPLPEARLPAEAPSLHEGLDGGSRVRGGRGTFEKRCKGQSGRLTLSRSRCRPAGIRIPAKPTRTLG